MKFTLYQPQAIYELGKRDNQEDAIYPMIGEATDRDRIFILCDGMGGHEKGEVASNTISKALAEYLNKNASADAVVGDNVLLAALEYAYKQLDAKDDGAAKKMGTTLCLLLFHRGGLTAMHIGDSRIYHIRPSEKRLLYQSKDHSLVYDLYQAGEISYDEMRTSPQKNIITRAIQPGEDNRVRPSIVHITDIRPGDYFYICSDGMLEQMENDELCNLFSANTSDDKKRQQLIAGTFDNKDNHSAYFIHINNVLKEEGDDNLLNNEQTSSDNALNIKPRKTEQDVSVVSANDSHDDVVEVVDKPQNAKKSTNKKVYIVMALIVCIFIGGLSYFKNYKSNGIKQNNSTATIKGGDSDSAVRKDSYKIKPISRSKTDPTKANTANTKIEHKSDTAKAHSKVNTSNKIDEKAKATKLNTKDSARQVLKAKLNQFEKSNEHEK